jgi:O-antigen/teichoic acid export membrane protein
MLLASPALTRIYTPTDFAALAIFVSIVNISVVFVSAKYEMSILLPESDLHACWITQICVMLTLLFSCIFSIFFLGVERLFLCSCF